jgi:hypothetical protein
MRVMAHAAKIMIDMKIFISLCLFSTFLVASCFFLRFIDKLNLTNHSSMVGLPLDRQRGRTKLPSATNPGPPSPCQRPQNAPSDRAPGQLAGLSSEVRGTYICTHIQYNSPDPSRSLDLSRNPYLIGSFSSSQLGSEVHAFP